MNSTIVKDSSKTHPRAIGAVSRLFAFMVRKSMDRQTSDPQAACERPNFHVEIWPDFGPMPIAKIPSKFLAAFAKLVTLTHRMLLKLPQKRESWRTIDEAIVTTRKIYGKVYPEDVMKPNPEDLSNERLYEQTVVSGFYHLKANPDATHSLDLNVLTNYDVQQGLYPYGGVITISYRDRSVLHIVSPEGKTVRPGDADWALQTLRFRTSFFAYLTLVPHSAWIHGMMSPKLFLATQQLPENHPLAILLKPFVYDVHKNTGRAKTTVFSESGVSNVASALTTASTQSLMVNSRKLLEVKLFDELTFPDDLRAQIYPIWEAIHNCVSQFIEKLNIREDEAVKQWRRFLSTNVNQRLEELPLADAVTYLLFTSTVAHHMWGHIFHGTNDPTYVSALNRIPPNGSAGNLLDAAEPVHVTLLRAGVISSIRREHIKLASNLSCTTTDPEARQIFYSFFERMDQIVKHADSSLRFDRLPVSGML